MTVAAVTSASTSELFKLASADPRTKTAARDYAAVDVEQYRVLAQAGLVLGPTATASNATPSLKSSPTESAAATKKGLTPASQTTGKGTTTAEIASLLVQTETRQRSLNTQRSATNTGVAAQGNGWAQLAASKYSKTAGTTNSATANPAKEVKAPGLTSTMKAAVRTAAGAGPTGTKVSSQNASSNVGTSSANKVTRSPLLDPADANGDGEVSMMEQLQYDSTHPSASATST